MGEDALDWVRGKNGEAERRLGESAASQNSTATTVQTLEEEILTILDDPRRIPMATFRGGYAYNFWTDKDHQRGLWRRQREEDYQSGKDDWQILIDVDALAKAEGKSWVWHGASILPARGNRALISLSNGGTDADETREFDLSTCAWVEGGFYRPEGKGSLSWIDQDHCWLTQPLDAESTSPSGYPLQARILKRDQAIEESAVILAATPDSMGVWAGKIRDSLGNQSVIEVMTDFYNSKTYLIRGDGPEITSGVAAQLNIPSTSVVNIWNDWALVWLREDLVWQGSEESKTFTAGTLVAALSADLLEEPGYNPFITVFEPSATEVLENITVTRDYVVLTTTDDVVSRLKVATPNSNGLFDHWETYDLSVPWDLPKPRTQEPKDGATSVPQPRTGEFLTSALRAVDPVSDNRIWAVTTGFTKPSTLWLVDLEGGEIKAAVEATWGSTWVALRQAPTLFDASDVSVTQHFTSSLDGTPIPYFQVMKEGVEGPRKTLLYGYGGFNVSLLPSYSPVVGRAWLEKGGVYVVANIRGGGEYGPNWHRFALKENRHKAYEDFVAVARDLVARGVTTPSNLGTQGGSNGGLLMGNMYTQYPDDFGAVLCQVPLLDMGRFHTLLAGHSWIAEYGNPEVPEEWRFIQTFSPLHQFNPNREYPALMVTTSTKDDRVHPAHARSFAYLALAAGKDVTYFENIEGGHAGAADNRQRAHNQALGWAFLWQNLG